MNFNVENENGICRVGIEGEMTIYTAAQLKDSLIGEIATCEELELNLAHVDEIDTAGVQLLALIKREALERGKSLRFVAHSHSVMEVLDMCNLVGVFGDPVVIC